MAKKIRDEEISLSITINGSKAQKELHDLEIAQRELNESNKALILEKKRLEVQNKKGSAEWKKLDQEIRSNNVTLKTNETRMKELQKEVGITGLTMRQLKSEASRLRLLLFNLIPGSADHKRYTADLDRINARLNELKLNGRSAKSSIGGLADGFNRYAALGASVIATMTGMVLSIQKMMDFSGKLSDAQSDVEKTTNLSSEAVKKLTINLGLFKTRSARIELLALAEEAGRLGKKSVDDVMEFVKTGDKIKVALGDDLKGDVNENIRIIGKLTEQYRVGAEIGATFGEGMEMIGSAINEVASAGTAQADYLVDYLNRMVGVSRQANITAEQITGIGAVLDEAGQQVETSATAVSQVIINMAKDTETYAKIAGMSTKEFTDLIKTDANEALLKFLDGLNGNNEGLTELSKKFEGLGIDGNRAITVLSALSSQTDKIREKQQLASVALNEATSLTEEARKKNENFGAILDNLRKRMVKLILEGGFVGWLQETVTWLAKFVGAIDDTDGSVTRFRERLIFVVKALTIATVALFSHKGALQLITLWTNRATAGNALHTIGLKAKSAATYIATTAQGLYIISTSLLTGKIKLATAAQRAMNLVFAANPIGALVAVIAAATTAYLLFREEQGRVAAAQRAINDINLEGEKAIVSQRLEIGRLLKVAKDENASKERRLKAMENLRAIAPDYLGDLKLEEINTLKAKKAVDGYIESLRDKAMVQAMEKKMVDLATERLDKQNESLYESVSWYEQLWNAVKSGGNPLAAEAENMKTAFENRQKEIGSIDAQIEALEKLYDEKKKSNDPGSESDFTDVKLKGLAASIRQEFETLKKEFEKSGESFEEFQMRKIEAYKKTISTLTEEEINEREKAQEEIRKFLVKAAGSEEEQIREKYAKLLDLAKKYSQKDLPALLASMNEELQDQLLKDLEEEWEITDKNNEKKLKREEDFQQRIQDVRSKYGLLTSKDIYEAELAELEQVYNEGLLTHEEYLKAKSILDEKWEDQKRAVRDQYYLVSIHEKHKEELKDLEDHYKNETLTYQEYLEAKKNLTLEHVSEVISFYGQIASAFSDLVSNMKNLELARIEEVNEKEYEVMQRRGESEEAFQKRKEKAEKRFTAAKAREEKERHDVAKKYAVLEALTSISQIGVNTAVAVTKALAELGPIMGPIMAGLMIASGLAQTGIALAELKKIRSYDTGLYDVIDQNNSRYRANRNEDLPSGLYSKPTVSFRKNMLIAEKRPEIIVDGQTTRKIMQFRPDIIETINSMRAGRVKSYDSGNYPAQGNSIFNAPATDMSETNALLRALLEKSGRPALAILPDKTRQDINERNALDDLIRKNSKINR